MSSTHDRRLGRGLDSFSHLFFSGEPQTANAAGAPEIPDAAGEISPSAPVAERPGAGDDRGSLGSPRTLFVTAFRRGSGKSLVSAGIAEACRPLVGAVAEWQLGPGVVVPRRGDRFDLPIPHPSERRAFEQLAASAGQPDILLLDGPIGLVGDGDPFALSAEEFLVIVLPGQEGAAEGYASVKEIVNARPDAPVRLVVNRAASQDEARELFHRIADVAERHLGRALRSYGGLPVFGRRTGEEAGNSTEWRALAYSRIAQTIAARARRTGSQPAFFDDAWTRSTPGRG